MQNKGFLIIAFLTSQLFCADHVTFSRIFPFTSLKRVVDTAMRAYTDLLILEERLLGYEKCDDLIDLLIGRLMRLSSYIDQIIHEFKHEATVIRDEIEYLIQVLEYMELSAESLKNEAIPSAINTLIRELKLRLKQSIENL